jgi:hypothetical protein
MLAAGSYAGLLLANAIAATLAARGARRCGKTHNGSLDPATGRHRVEIAADVRNATAERLAWRHAGIDLPPWWHGQSIWSDDMPTIAFNTDGRSTAQAPAGNSAHGPTLLAEAELDHVAAAGGKGGVTGGDVRCRHPAGAQ